MTATYEGQHARAVTAGVPSGVRDAFEQRLKNDGILGALAFLNDRTRFRFTGLYRLAPPALHNVSLFDRENPTLNVSGAVCALEESYCSIIWTSGDPLVIADSRGDARVVQHSRRDAIQSYAGVPVRPPGGRLVGSLCHFDGRPRLLPASELAVLTSVAPLLAAWLVVDS
ncbi:MAG: GAF domain-containing protein [Gemmatimonadaceae bacterium]|nr:GAF domain-containing protein [Gemmatimonadaceae bacterium]